MSGGHIRVFVKMLQKALDHTDSLPIQLRAIKRAIADAQDEMRDVFYDSQWELLRTVEKTHHIPRKENNPEYQRLLASRCLLEFHYYHDEQEKLSRWYRVNPLIRAMEKFSGD